MASRTKQKEEARARRLAEEQQRAERERRQRRLRMTGGVILVAVAVIAIAIAVSSSGGGKSGLQTGTTLSKSQAQVSQLLNGIPQSGAVLGKSTAPVTLYYYGDLECPVCRDFTFAGGWPRLVANDVRQGKVKVVYRAFETATRDPSTFQTQQVAALAAGKQSRFFNFMELFYREQGQEGTNYVTEAYLDGLARQIPGLSFSQWRSDRSDSALAAQVQADGAAGNSAGVSGTPTVIAKGPKGTVPVSSSTGVPSYSDLQKAIQASS